MLSLTQLPTPHQRLQSCELLCTRRSTIRLLSPTCIRCGTPLYEGSSTQAPLVWGPRGSGPEPGFLAQPTQLSYGTILLSSNVHTPGLFFYDQYRMTKPVLNTNLQCTACWRSHWAVLSCTSHKATITQMQVEHPHCNIQRH